MSPSCKPELLAPAGSIESFYAAIEAGADAIYCGLADFNARLRAKNFTPHLLACLLPHARKHTVKVYVTLNTLVKQAELEPVIHTLYQLSQIGIDGLIVADHGVIHLCRTHFPSFRLHASTQMAVHNSAGIRAAARLGLKRAVLSRELTVEEVRSIRAAGAIELEVFVHGALCYCISGLCLASSFLGGASGNRGRCTQACRRRFSTAGGSGYFFSPRDLCAAEFLPIFRELGVSALKIEGRMKPAAYVFAVVNAYRKLLDNEVPLEKACGLLDRDLGRSKTTFFLGGVKQSGIIDAGRSGTGLFLGPLVPAQGNLITLPESPSLIAGDRIRIQPQTGYEGESAVVTSVAHEQESMIVSLNKAVTCCAGDAVYLVGRKADERRFENHEVNSTQPVRFEKRCPFAGKILKSITIKATSPAQQRDVLWIKINNIGWLEHLSGTPCQRLIFSGNLKEASNLLNKKELLKIWKSRLFIGLPLFIPESELLQWQSLIDQYTKSGIQKGVCSNISHTLLFKSGSELVADATMAPLNSSAQFAIKSMGFESFIFSCEDDYLNIKATTPGPGIACLFAHIPLFISRIQPAVKPETVISDPQENQFITFSAEGLYYLVSKQPFNITHRRNKLSSLGIHDFLIDLSFCKPDQEFLHTLIGCYKNQTRLPGSSMFNFKAGLK